MSIAEKVSSFWKRSEWPRKQYGFLPGLRLASQLRTASSGAEPGILAKLSIPEIAHLIWVRARTSEVRVVEQLYRERELDFDLSKAPATIIDAAVNIGLASALLASCYLSARIIALEVHSANFRLLERNVARYGNVNAIPVGLWSHRARLGIVDGTAEAWAIQVTENPAGNIEAWDIEALLEQFPTGRISLLKMEIEGAERTIFNDHNLDWLDHVDVLAVESHDRMFPDCSGTVRRATRRAGFSERMVGEYHVFERR